MVIGSRRSLTKAQAEVLAFIEERLRDTGVSPSYREIQVHFGYRAIGSVQDHVQALMKKGALERPKTKEGRSARGLLPKGHLNSRGKELTIYGEIAAGSTRETAQLDLGALVITPNFAKDPCFALRVTGNSMIDVGIFEGDFLIVEKTNRVRSGEIIVALLEGETTVKRYVKQEGKIHLVPENKTMQPICVMTERFEIQGRVVGLQRRFS